LYLSFAHSSQSFSSGFSGHPFYKIILAAVNVDREAYNRAIDLGIDIVCGNVIDF
jgi:hypothetical protein